MGINTDNIKSLVPKIDMSLCLDDAYWLRMFAMAAMQALLPKTYELVKGTTVDLSILMSKCHTECVYHAKNVLAEIHRVEGEKK
jgi:hypothetical protein